MAGVDPNDTQKIDLLDALRRAPGHELLMEHLRQSIAQNIGTYLTMDSTKAEKELLRLQADAAARYQLLREISLDDLDAAKFARDQMRRMEADMKEEEARYMKEREARSRSAYPI